MKIEKIKKGCGISLIILIILIIGFFWMFKKAFGPDEYSVSIDQNIGGKLICDVTYSADIQSWYYDINYEYEKPNGTTFNFGKGFYQGIEWNENDQLYEYKNWKILPTGSDYGSIKIIAFDLDKNKKTEFEISPNSIEKDSLWISKQIESLEMWSPSKVEIDKIIENKILVQYTFRIDRQKTDKLESTLIEYELDNESGILKMKSIEKLK